VFLGVVPGSDPRFPGFDLDLFIHRPVDGANASMRSRRCL
jgi:hypothetical protein